MRVVASPNSSKRHLKVAFALSSVLLFGFANTCISYYTERLLLPVMLSTSADVRLKMMDKTSSHHSSEFNDKKTQAPDTKQHFTAINHQVNTTLKQPSRNITTSNTRKEVNKIKTSDTKSDEPVNKSKNKATTTLLSVTNKVKDTTHNNTLPHSTSLHSTTRPFLGRKSRYYPQNTLVQHNYYLQTMVGIIPIKPLD